MLSPDEQDELDLFLASIEDGTQARWYVLALGIGQQTLRHERWPEPVGPAYNQEDLIDLEDCDE